MILLSDDFWEIRKTADRGRGVFAKKIIPAGTVIGDYIGKITPIADDDKYDVGYTMFLMYFNTKASLYPDRRKSGIHIINHSCMPNCYMYDFNGHVLYFSLRAIFPGEELLVDYLLEPLDRSCKPCTHICKCGEVMCRGTWHLTAKRAKAWDDFVKVNIKKQKRAKYIMGKELPLLPHYPEVVHDQHIYPLFGNPSQPPYIFKDSILPPMATLRKTIRETGQTLKFPTLNIHILGIQDEIIIAD